MKIATAYDAFWFLKEHPKFRCKEAALVSEKRAKTLKLPKGHKVRRVKDDAPWLKDKTYLLHEYPLYRKAMDSNLDIYWVKVDERKKVNDDPRNNKFAECWLEFGTIRQSVFGGELRIESSHDWRLDCGAPTFDQALVKLARLVRKHYGDYKAPAWLTPSVRKVAEAEATVA